MRDLIHAGAEVDAISKMDLTPLHVASACRDGKYHTAACLLMNDADAGASDCQGWTPLHFAVENGHVQIGELLVMKFADIECKDDDGDTPLHLAAWVNNVDFIEWLVDEGAILNVVGKHENTPLYIAASYPSFEAVWVLIRAGTCVNVSNGNGETPLHFASALGHEKVVRLLLNEGADPQRKRHEGWTALRYASFYRRIATVEALLHAGATETATTDDNETPLDILELESWKGCTMRTECVRQLLVQGPSIRAWGRRGWVVMVRARHHREVEVWEALCGQELLNKNCRDSKLWPWWQAPSSEKLSFLDAVMWSREQESGIFRNVELFL